MPAQVRALYSVLDSPGGGYVPKDAWVTAIEGAMSEITPKEAGGGIQGEGEGGKEKEGGAGGGEPKFSHICAALAYNGLNVKQGYAAFDADEDGQVRSPQTTRLASTNLKPPSLPPSVKLGGSRASNPKPLNPKP